MPMDPQSQATSLPSLHFLPWEQPLAEGIAELLLREATAGAALDLSNHLVIVPSQFASRLLTEKLAETAGARGVFLPRITTPSRFLNWGDAQHSVASEEHSLLTWVKILTSIDRADFPALFAGGQTGPFRYEAALDFARELIQLRDELAGSREGLNFAEMAQKAVRLNAEPDRWSDLSKLEDLYDAELKSAGKTDHNTLRRELALGDGHPEGIRVIWLAGVLAPQPLLLRALEGIRQREQAAVRVVAGGGSTELFDEWGQPLADVWKNRRSPWDGFSECVHVVPKLSDAHARLISILRRGSPTAIPLKPGTVSIVPCDRENEPKELEYTVRRATGGPAGATANALGEPHKNHETHYALRLWLDFLPSPSFHSLRKVTLHPTLARALCGRKSDFQTCNLALDGLSALHPPGDLNATAAFCELQIHNFREEAAQGSHESKHRNTDDEAIDATTKEPEAAAQTKKDPAWKLVLAREILDEAIELHRKHVQMRWDDLAKEMADLCSDDVPNDTFGAAVVENFIDIVERLEASAGETTAEDEARLLRLAVETAGETRYRGDINPEAVNLPGWQDAPWEPAPHLIVFGMNDNFVPGGKSAHPYLPASLRRALGLQSPEQTFANAAFVLEQLRRRRSNPETSRLDVIVPQFSDEGDGLKPSRLLFLAPIDPETDSADALLGPKGRINKLFRELPQERSLPYWEIPLGCRFDPAAPLEKVGKIKARAAATDLRMFLNNAQEYWLKKALGTRENDHEALELSAAEFGVLIHSAMEEFKADKTKEANQQVGRISAELAKHLEAIAAKRLGSAPSPALRNQVAAAAERMAWLAEVEAEISKEWETVAVEAALPELNIGGFALHGRFDRLDRHRTERRRWRVYDYKTTNNPKTPKEAHVSKYASNHKADDAFVIESEGTNYRWKDVQLVVYDWCLQKGVIQDPALKQAILELRTEGSIVEVAYINISNNKLETRLDAWDDFHLFRQAGRDAIKAAAQKLMSGDHKVFSEAVITGDGAKYPMLPGLKERKTTDYMIGENFGKGR